jgi:hypothetical protein
VGYVYPPDDSIENGFIVTKNGEYREFSVPWAAYTEARGINNRGVITGTAFFIGPGSAGFIDDPEAPGSNAESRAGDGGRGLAVHSRQLPGLSHHPLKRENRERHGPFRRRTFSLN